MKISASGKVEIGPRRFPSGSLGSKQNTDYSPWGEESATPTVLLHSRALRADGLAGTPLEISLPGVG
jgi:hypothetical protein